MRELDMSRNKDIYSRSQSQKSSGSYCCILLVTMAVDELYSDQQPLLSNGGHDNEYKIKETRIFLSLAKWVLKFTMWVVFVAWVALFFLVPTDFGTGLYDVWVSATSGTLFGETGSVLLLYSGPIIIIAFLAVPYLLVSGEEQQKEQLQEKRPPRYRLWTFPVLVDGPFGVVSAAELIGIVLFVMFVLWAVYAYTVENFEILPSYGDLTLEEKRLFMLQMSAYTFGLIALSCLAFLFLPIARGSILLRLVDIPFEHATRYHVWLGNLTMFLLTLHGLCYMILWAIRGIIPSEIIEWKSDGGANLAGVICYVFGLLIWVTTLPPVRKRYFELFFYTHQLYVLFVIFLALHIGDTNFSKVFGGIFLFMLDRFLRFCQSRTTVNIVSMKSLPCGTVKLVLSKPGNLRYNALSFIFLRVREISWLQWHPFSVSSSPLDGKHHLSVLIKAFGDWTSILSRKVSNITEDSQIELPLLPRGQIMASVEGPYGHESPYHLMYEKLVLVAGGSGISPFLAILSDILHRTKDKKTCVPRNVLLVWAVKRSNELSLFSSTGVESICSFFSDKLNIEVQMYVTRESEPSLEEGNIYKATSSSVFSMGGGISALVGTGNKIWVGCYVIISTIGFVISLSLLDICYINPFSISYWWYKGLLFVACMVVSVLIYGGIVVGLWHLWDKRTLVREESQEDGVKTDMMRRNEVFTEKNLYQETLASSYPVRYGCRPDFKEIFGSVSARWGSVDVGVVVCGPQTLLSSVAKECRSQNLERRNYDPIFHFNSHSFYL
ncbi:ferric reduction oxidase 7, chloroplastic-like isoform X1 [Juglans microcarpa x Juglans regia]|uniref:ferric reduction oxidase 7, chloroplastic-like isoform X1 n=1 Tax=Juglans microcarpa x Juglans regia TaxID=2249226 RepID=UPI001B7DEF79|nr:ferric reduction oxidase 7, chloroplastic-like isoform X1 [Juglans microcarpa x Juglans regia]